MNPARWSGRTPMYRRLNPAREREVVERLLGPVRVLYLGFTGAYEHHCKRFESSGDVIQLAGASVRFAYEQKTGDRVLIWYLNGDHLIFHLSDGRRVVTTINVVQSYIKDSNEGDS